VLTRGIGIRRGLAPDPNPAFPEYLTIQGFDQAGFPIVRDLDDSRAGPQVNAAYAMGL
jgi:hypothetical protein